MPLDSESDRQTRLSASRQRLQVQQVYRRQSAACWTSHTAHGSLAGVIPRSDHAYFIFGLGGQAAKRQKETDVLPHRPSTSQNGLGSSRGVSQVKRRMSWEAFVPANFAAAAAAASPALAPPRRSEAAPETLSSPMLWILHVTVTKTVQELAERSGPPPVGTAPTWHLAASSGTLHDPPEKKRKVNP